MKKSTIIMAALAIMSVLSFMYAFVMRAEAQQQTTVAMSNMQRAVKAMEETENCRIAAQQQLEVAKAQTAIMEAATLDAIAATETERQRADKSSKKKK